MGAELIAVYVEDMELRDEAQTRAVHDHLTLAEKQGAMLTTIYGNDPATAIAQYARVSGITKIVLGKSPGRRTRDTLMSRLNELAPNVEVIIVPNRLTANANATRLSRFLRRERFSVGDILKTALILAACTGVGFLFSAVGLACALQGRPEPDFTGRTVTGALANHVRTPSADFQPMNANFGILEPLTLRVRGKKNRYEQLSRRAIDTMSEVIRDYEL